MSLAMRDSSSPQFPLCAVVTPVYNGQEYLDEAMVSVQAQLYPNLFHIVLDNCSTDKTPDILSRYAGVRVPVMVCRNPSLLPIAQNWNTALSLIPPDAKYFRVLCADDWMAPEFMSIAVDVLERNASADVAAVLFHENDGPAVDARWPAEGEVIAGREAIKRYFRDGALLPALHAVHRCASISPSYPFYDEALVAFDIDATLRVLCNGDMGMVRTDLAMTRLHPRNHTAQVIERERRHYYEWLYFLNRYAAIGLDPKEADALLKRYRRQYLRLLIKWRAMGDNQKFAKHMEGLGKLGHRPDALQFLDALLDYPLVRLKVREPWRGYPLWDLS